MRRETTSTRRPRPAFPQYPAKSRTKVENKHGKHTKSEIITCALARRPPRPRKGTERSNRSTSSTIDDREFYVSVASTLDSHDTPDLGMLYSQKALLFPTDLPHIRTCLLFLHIPIWGEVLCKFLPVRALLAQKAAPRPRKGTERSNRSTSSTIDDQEFYVSVASPSPPRSTPTTRQIWACSTRRRHFSSHPIYLKFGRAYYFCIPIWGEVLCKFLPGRVLRCPQCSTRRPRAFPLLRQSRRRKDTQRKEQAEGGEARQHQKSF